MRDKKIARTNNKENEASCYKKAIGYCVNDICDSDNLELLSNVAQKLWVKEKKQKPD